MISDAELDRLKADNPCDAYAGRLVRLRRGAKRQVGPCPICSRNSQSTTDQRFEVDAAGWVCAVCDDGGDVIKLVSKIENITFLEAVERLGGVREVDPAIAARRAAELAADRAERERDSEFYRERERNSLHRIWQAAAPAPGSPVEHYLGQRGVALPPGARLRSVAQMAYFDGELVGDDGRKYRRILHRGPAMIAAIQGADGKFRGLHFTYLDPDQAKGKATIADPDTGEIKDAKKVRGSKSGGRVELVRPPAFDRLVIGEGIETVLTAWCAAVPGYWAGIDLDKTAFWSALDLGNLGGAAAATVLHPSLKDAAGRRRRVPGPVPNLDRPGIEIPDEVVEIVLLGDGDSDRFNTENALRRAAARFARPGRLVRVAWAPDGQDFNDIGPAAAAAIIAAAVPFDAPAAAQEVAPASDSIVEADQALPPASAPPSAAREARDFGFDIEAMNRRFALVVLGGKSVIYWEHPGAAIEQRKRFIAEAAFKSYFNNRITEYVDSRGEVKTATWGTMFLRHRDRRTYDGVEFFPDPDNAPGLENHLNLWGGFSVAPAAKADPARFSVFRDHVFENICSGHQEHFLWVWGFFAHMLQRPRERIGTALVLRGRQGVGKTKLGEVMGSLIAAHYFLVDDPRYVTGNFNAHMATCLLLQADEAVWAGDKAAEGRLKGLITAPMQQIEAKGVDPIRLPNYIRLLLTSNEDWVIPAGKDERRMGVLDVSDRCAQNIPYFQEMDEQLNNGGLAHLLADLLAFDLSRVNLRQPIRTEALLEQKVRTLDPVDNWMFACLNQGTLPRQASTWPAEVAITALYHDYLHAADEQGVKRKQDQISFGIKLRKLIPGLDRVRSSVEVSDHGVRTLKRTWCYRLPPLGAVRAAWEVAFGQRIGWDVPLEPDQVEVEVEDFTL